MSSLKCVAASDSVASQVVDNGGSTTQRPEGGVWPTDEPDALEHCGMSGLRYLVAQSIGGYRLNTDGSQY